MTVARLPLLTLALGLAACSQVGGPYPSLQPRAAESLDPRLPVERPRNDRPVTPAVAQRLAQLVAQAHSGDAAFGPLASQAERLAGSAAGPGSESWIAAQEALSAAVAARGPAGLALGASDAIGALRLADQGGLAPYDLAAVQAAAAEAGAIERRQAARIAGIQRRLGI
jgi:hypothetical protein